MNEEDYIKEQAEAFARAHRKEIAKELTDIKKYLPDEVPLSIFMAGSPGAGKTEYSKGFLALLEKENSRKIIRIDGDELRARIPGYTGANSYLFQTAVSLIVERVHDYALSNKQTFIFDGTFSKYEKAVSNIERSLSKGRRVQIFYVYHQNPKIAWKFTQAREVIEGRNIPKQAFIQQFLDSRDTINRIAKDFHSKVLISLVIKNFASHEVQNIVEISQNVKIDDYIQEHYTYEDLEKLL
jgi:UDP-N-acetylglucosamine kinase